MKFSREIIDLYDFILNLLIQYIKLNKDKIIAIKNEYSNIINITNFLKIQLKYIIS